MASDDGSQKTFQFFGNVWMKEPVLFLDEDDFRIVRRYMPLIQALDSEWQSRVLMPIPSVLPGY